MKTIDVGKHFTELDRSILQHYDAYVEYFRHIEHVLNCLLTSLQGDHEERPYEVRAIKRATQGILNTIQCLSLKYAYEDEHMMKIDLTESSFPNYLEIKKMVGDIEFRDRELAKLDQKESLKRDVLDQLIQEHRDPVEILRKVAKVAYLEKLGEGRFFKDFNPGKLELVKELDDKSETRRFLFDWSAYDTVTNRPYIYVMVFDNPRYFGKKTAKAYDQDEFIEAIKKATHNSAPLKVIASDIDSAFESVFPKVLKRIDLGPLHGKYAMDEHPYSKLVKDHFGGDDFVFTYTTEVIFSVGEKRTSSFLSKGDLRQIFFVDESNKECMDRMVSKVHNYMLSTHRVVQYLNDNFKEELKSLAAQPYICAPVDY